MSEKIEIEIIEKGTDAATNKITGGLKKMEDQANKTAKAMQKIPSISQSAGQQLRYGAAQNLPKQTLEQQLPPVAYTSAQTVAADNATRKTAQEASKKQAGFWASLQGGKGLGTAVRTFALHPLMRAVLVGGGIGGIILGVLIMIMEVLKVGMSGLSKMLGALIKVMGMIIKPIFDILMIALMPLLYLLMPFIKAMNLIFAPLRKRLMEKIKRQIEEGKMDPTEVMSWANMGLLLFEAFGGIITTLGGVLLEAIANMIVGAIALVSPEVAAGLKTVIDFFAGIADLAVKCVGRDNIDIVIGFFAAVALLAIGLFGWEAVVAGVSGIIAWFVGLIGGTSALGITGAAGTAIGTSVAAIAGTAGWFATFIANVGILPAAAVLGLAVASIIGLILVFADLPDTIEKTQEWMNSFREALGFKPEKVRTAEEIRTLAQGAPQDLADIAGWGWENIIVKRFEGLFWGLEDSGGGGAMAVRGLNDELVTLEPSLAGASTVVGNLADSLSGFATAVVNRFSQENLGKDITDMVGSTGYTGILEPPGAGGRSTREIESARWDAAQAAAGTRFEQALADWKTVNAEFTESNRPGMTAETMMEGLTGWGSTPAGQKVLDEYYEKYPELIGILDATGPTLEMFRNWAATASKASATFSTTLADGTVLVADSLASLQAKIDAFSMGGTPGGAAGGGGGGYGLPSGYSRWSFPGGSGVFKAGEEPPGSTPYQSQGATTDFGVGYATGGYVRKTGVALVHQGENIVPAGGGGGGRVNIDFSGSFPNDLKRDLRDFMEEYMRDQLTRRGS